MGALLFLVLNCMFAFFAFRIGKIIESQDGKKPQQRLIYIHFVNLMGYSISAALVSWIDLKDKEHNDRLE